MLNELRNQELRRLELKKRILELEQQLPALEKEQFAAYIEAHNEQVDYDNLNRFSLKNWFLDVTGKKEALLDKERREAQAAKLKHDTAKRQVEWVCQQLTECREELCTLSGCSAKYWKALETLGNPQLMQEHRERLGEELTQARSFCVQVLELLRRIMGHVSYQHDQNEFGFIGGNNMVQPGQMASLQKQIEKTGRQIDLFLEQARNLGLKEQIVPPDRTINIQDDQNWAEILTPMTRVTLLSEAYLRMEKAVEELTAIQTKLTQQIELLNG